MVVPIAFGQSDTGHVLLYLCLLAVCLYVARTDIYERRIPNRALLFGLLFSVIVAFLFIENYLWSMHALSGAVFFLGFALFSFCLPFAMGMGDAKLLGFMAFALGFQEFLSMLTITCVTAFLAAFFLSLTKKVSARDTLPFAPFVVVGMLWQLLSVVLDFV